MKLNANILTGSGGRVQASGVFDVEAIGASVFAVGESPIATRSSVDVQAGLLLQSSWASLMPYVRAPGKLTLRPHAGAVVKAEAGPLQLALHVEVPN